jgi:hypothetical protein
MLEPYLNVLQLVPFCDILPLTQFHLISIGKFIVPRYVILILLQSRKLIILPYSITQAILKIKKKTKKAKTIYIFC